MLVVTGEVTVDRAAIGFITGIPVVYAGAVAGVELGRSCCDEVAASAVLSVPKGLGCADWIGLDPEGAVDARRSMRFGLPVPATGAAAGGEDGAA